MEFCEEAVELVVSQETVDLARDRATHPGAVDTDALGQDVSAGQAASVRRELVVRA
jgi:hypothetical protein